MWLYCFKVIDPFEMSQPWGKWWHDYSIPYVTHAWYDEMFEMPCFTFWHNNYLYIRKKFLANFFKVRTMICQHKAIPSKVGRPSFFKQSKFRYYIYPDVPWVAFAVFIYRQPHVCVFLMEKFCYRWYL